MSSTTSAAVEPLHAQLLTQALAREAYLLDTNQYDRWLETLASDVRYLVPIPEWVHGRSGAEEAFGTGDDALSFPYLDETHEGLRLRVARLQTGLAHGEMPPSMTARVVGVALIEELANDRPPGARNFRVITNFTLHQTRHETRVDVFAGRREDVWSVGPDDGPQVLLHSRTVHLIERVLPRAFSTFF
ncbi:aromatic-ring-hydroxylating dioxygenase subunit beta [Egicoccus sp. AB-alg6-2]|uniref:aromatic-ring-hydroxylating dioxygenase subunit beta n=1 Tax=Egicoccus sp. AB-alg6-2 TaxID=3242692 RepID=UPI00359E50FC